MFDDLIKYSTITFKTLRSTKIEEFEVIIFDVSINLHRKAAVIVAGEFQ